jgi:hypothetical protein
MRVLAMKKLSLLVTAVFLSSCVGVKTDISINKDLSGIVSMEYTVSEELLKLGTLDGNEAWPIIPTGKADVERAVSRVKGLSLKSFSEKQKGKDRVFSVSFNFENIESLCYYLNGAGQSVFYKTEGGGPVLSFETGGKGTNLQSDLSELALSSFEGYNFELTVSPPPGAVSGGKQTLSIPMGRLVTGTEKETFELQF